MRRTGHLEAALMSSYIIQLLSSRATDYGYYMDLQMPEVEDGTPSRSCLSGFPSTWIFYTTTIYIHLSPSPSAVHLGNEPLAISLAS